MRVPKMTEEQKEWLRKVNEGLRKFDEALSILDQIEDLEWGW